eukprot:11550507-Prorocentrum_lima.AAC.1
MSISPSSGTGPAEKELRDISAPPSRANSSLNACSRPLTSFGGYAAAAAALLSPISATCR